MAYVLVTAVFLYASTELLRNATRKEGTGKEVVAMAGKQMFRHLASATALALSGVTSNLAATAVLG